MRSTARTTVRVLAAGFLIIFLIFFALSAPFYRQQYRLLQTWQRAEAEVVSSRVVTVRTAGAPLYDAEYVFAFRAHGVPVVATTYSNHQSTSRERKAAQVARFPAGSRHTILYNPADPQDIRMAPGYNVHFFAVPIFISAAGALFGLIALVLWLIVQRGAAVEGNSPTVTARR